jgi:hypothetical protein
MPLKILSFSSSLALLLLMSHATAWAQDPPESLESVCNVTQPNGVGLGYGNDALSTSVFPRGTVVFWPAGGGYVANDGALGIKQGWRRTIRGYLSIEGRRLDAEASRLSAWIPPPSNGYGDFGFTSTEVIYPTPGCWEVSAWVGNRTDLTLTFVIRVVQVAGGPTGYGPTPWLRRPAAGLTQEQIQQIVGTIER